jgi:hypothetical protein
MNKKIISIIFSFLFSVILWGSVSLSNDYYTKIHVPLKFVNIPAGYAVSDPNIHEITISVRSQGWRLAALSMDRAYSFFIPANRDSGMKKIALRDALSENAWLSSNIQILGIYPEFVNVSIEKIFFKKVKIRPDLSFGFKQNFGIVSPVKLTPDSVIISGPKSIIKRVNYVTTVKKKYTDLEDGVKEMADLQPVYGVEFEKKQTYIQFYVQRIVDKVFSNLPVEVRNAPPGMEIVVIPNIMTLKLRGGINSIGRLTKEDFHPYIDFSQLLKDTLGTLEPIIKIPDYTIVISRSPNRLKYIVKKH